MLTNSIRFALLALILSAVTYAGITVDRWHRDSVALATLKPVESGLRSERDDLSNKVRELEASNADLHQAISNQNHAIQLAQAQAESAKAQQEQAKAYAAKLETQKNKRIEQLEADLADSTKTLTDLLDTSWRQPR